MACPHGLTSSAWCQQCKAEKRKPSVAAVVQEPVEVKTWADDLPDNVKHAIVPRKTPVKKATRFVRKSSTPMPHPTGAPHYKAVDVGGSEWRCIASRFDGKCQGCNNVVLKGEPLVLYSDTSRVHRTSIKQWLCQKCALVIGVKVTQ